MAPFNKPAIANHHQDSCMPDITVGPFWKKAARAPKANPKTAPMTVQSKIFLNRILWNVLGKRFFVNRTKQSCDRQRSKFIFIIRCFRYCLLMKDQKKTGKTKVCYQCHNAVSVAFRIRHSQIKDWFFVCQLCCEKVQPLPGYQYGGTWKGARK